MKSALFLALLLLGAALHAQEESEDTWPDAFSKHFKGTIGGKLEVEMQLQGEPGTEVFFSGERQFRGHYWYANKRIPIDLFGEEPDFGKVKLEEQVFTGGDAGWETTGIFTGALDDDGSISGTWADKDGKRKLPFKLSPYLPPGAVKVKAHALQSSWRERTAAGTSSLERSVLLVQVADNSPAAQKINQSLLRNVHVYYFEPDPNAPAEDAEKKDDAEKKEDEPAEELTLDSISKVIAAERNEASIDNNEKWSSTCTAGVELNEHGLLCVSHLFSEYTGGAHPNGMTVYFTYDTKTGEELTPEQLFKPGFFDALPKIATEKFRKQEGKKPTDEDAPAIEAVDFAEDDDAWFLSPAGFVVHFDPYAVASYARGNVDLTIPWAELAPWVKPDGPLKPFLPAAAKK